MNNNILDITRMLKRNAMMWIGKHIFHTIIITSLFYLLSSIIINDYTDITNNLIFLKNNVNTIIIFSIFIFIIRIFFDLYLILSTISMSMTLMVEWEKERQDNIKNINKDSQNQI